jgi:hypothetical protein
LRSPDTAIAELAMRPRSRAPLSPVCRPSVAPLSRPLTRAPAPSALVAPGSREPMRKGAHLERSGGGRSRCAPFTAVRAAAQTVEARASIEATLIVGRISRKRSTMPWQ